MWSFNIFRKTVHLNSNRFQHSIVFLRLFVNFNIYENRLTRTAITHLDATSVATSTQRSCCLNFSSASSLLLWVISPYRGIALWPHWRNTSAVLIVLKRVLQNTITHFSRNKPNSTIRYWYWGDTLTIWESSLLLNLYIKRRLKISHVQLLKSIPKFEEFIWRERNGIHKNPHRKISGT